MLITDEQPWQLSQINIIDDHQSCTTFLYNNKTPSAA